MEHYRLKGDGNDDKTPADRLMDEDDAQTVITSDVEGGREWFEGDKEHWEKGMWEETWKSWTDSKKRGQSDPEMRWTRRAQPDRRTFAALQDPRRFRSMSRSHQRHTFMDCPNTRPRSRSLRPSEWRTTHETRPRRVLELTELSLSSSGSYFSDPYRLYNVDIFECTSFLVILGPSLLPSRLIL